MKRFTVPERKNQSSEPNSQELLKEKVSSGTQGQSGQVGVAGAVEKMIYFFKGKTSVFEINDFLFVKGYKIIDDVWCVFIHEEYAEQQKPIVTALEQIGLTFIHELSYMIKFEKMYKEAQEVFRSTGFWETLILKKVKTRQQFLETI
jgi:hypothetical protein